MSSSTARRRSRSQTEDADEADAARYGRRSSPSLSDGYKKMRLRGGRGQPSQREEDDEDDSASERSSDEDHSFPDGDNDVPSQRTNGHVTSNGTPTPKFATGSIVRVKVENFVIYEKAEFLPGPNLNMVIGPNGTGKSSLVCAICLGLGYPASVLGRATSFGEFVKHGKEHAIVEVELQKRPEDRANYVIKLVINREDNTRKFSLNGREGTLKQIQHVTRQLRIQIDNLCQFLPQDKVAEFAGLNSVELLTRTLQAAAPEVIMEQQNSLKQLFDEQKLVSRQLETDAETLRGWETRQQGLQADVERLKEREQIQARVGDLTDARLVLDYDEKRRLFSECREHKRKAQARQRRLEERCAPSLEDVNLKQEYLKKVQDAFEARERRGKAAEQVLEKTISSIEKIQESIDSVGHKKSAERESWEAKKKQISGFRSRINQLEGQYKSNHYDFNPAEWNHKIREQRALLDHEIRDEKQELDTATADLKERGKIKQQERRTIQQELENLNSQEGQRFLQLRRTEPEVATAWEWLQQNGDKFEKQVFGPPMLTCSIKDKRYSNHVQSLLQRDDFLCFTTQTRNDHKLLTDQFFTTMKIAVTVRTVTADLASFRSPVSQENLGAMGLDGYALDFVEGPEPVLAMLCSEKKLHLTGVALKDISEEQYQRINDDEVINSFATGNTMYRITRRREYGPGATSTMSRSIRPGTYWTDEPLDMAAKNELEQRLQECERDFAEMKKRNDDFKAKAAALKEKIDEVKEAVKRLEDEKSTLQREFNQWKALPDKIGVLKSSLQTSLKDLNGTKQRLASFDDEVDKLALEKARRVLEHKKQLDVLRNANQAIFEAAVHALEAKSDVAALKERNSGIMQRLEEEKQSLLMLVRQAEKAKDEAKAAQNVIMELLSTGPDNAIDEERRDFLSGIKEGHTLETMDAEIETENAKLDLIHAADPGVLQEFERRARDIERGQRDKAKRERQLESLSQQIQDLKDTWEPAVDDIINKINDAFSYNFEQINCAGEVSVHKDEDFDKWAIDIRVKFREEEALQKLDQHRQSGGERAVSTIFYLMSLQAMAQAPFRVVDEINQGMDPRNERMMHERMVEIACNEHASQYFLITPKLLSGLRYDERMKILCVASGEHMPQEGGKLDFSRCVKIKRRLVAAAGA
ncbi:Structural maintenance of chromosomes protein 5 [Diaporthe australafricana]|uniref:Structural maintenance of chromosomes protein 5 n=1 Tax=Diaporthe australafricana TaxID=127596 RepID=A0ABR3X8U8_9PEZI